MAEKAQLSVLETTESGLPGDRAALSAVPCRQVRWRGNGSGQSPVPAARTEYRGICGFRDRHGFLTALEAGSPRSRCRQIRFQVKAPSLASRWLPSHCALTRQTEGTPVSVPLFMGCQCHPNLVASKGPRYQHIGGWDFNI